MIKDYEYLTEHEKSILGYIENIPNEYPPYNVDVWDEDEEEELNALNDIFNL